MIFTKEHIEKIREGKKTETRRIWKHPHVKVGKVYGIRTDRFKPVPSDAPRIKIQSISRELLRDITFEGAIKEGCQSLGDFMDIWIKLHGSWNPNQEIYVVKFLRVEL